MIWSYVVQHIWPDVAKLKLVPRLFTTPSQLRTSSDLVATPGVSSAYPTTTLTISKRFSRNRDGESRLLSIYFLQRSSNLVGRSGSTMMTLCLAAKQLASSTDRPAP